jgi:hypothetical protein
VRPDIITQQDEVKAFQASLPEGLEGPFSELPPPIQKRLAALKSVELVVFALKADYSAPYLLGLLDATSLPEVALIEELSWGRYLDDLAGKPTGMSLLAIAASLPPEQRAVVSFLDIKPSDLLRTNTRNAITALSLIPKSDLFTLKELGVAEFMVNQFGTPPRAFSTVITTALSFDAALTPDQQAASRALGLGFIFYRYPAGGTFSSGVTALDRVEELTAFYANHPEYQESLQESRIFAVVGPLPITVEANIIITSTLAAYDTLPVRTRIYLSSLNGPHYNFFLVVNPPGAGATLRSLTDINSLLGDLSEAEFDTLLRLDLGNAVVGGDVSSAFVEQLGADPLSTLQSTISDYAALAPVQKQVLSDLGIIGDGNVAIIGADTDGLRRLLTAYAAIPGSLRATTERLDEFAANNGNIGSSYGFGISPGSADRSFFFTGAKSSGTEMQKVRFLAAGDLHVGATRELKIDNSALAADTFTVGAGKDLYLHAANLIDLTSTNFSNGIRSINMAAATINLTNVNFPAGSSVYLNSRDSGGVHFGTSITGRVNFISGVSYGGTVILSSGNEGATSLAGGKILIGSFGVPVQQAAAP